MRSLSIAYGNSRKAAKWSNKYITFDDLCKKLETTIRTTESVEEYKKMTRQARDGIKDKGGFVGGSLRDNLRKVENVVSRSMLTLDIDKAEPGFIEKYANESPYTSCLYTTHSHRPDANRCRIIVPLTRDVQPDEYVALAQYFAFEWGIDQFDECSYHTNQLMFWPTTPQDGEYIYKRVDKEWLNPDEFFKKYPNYKDLSLLPTSSRESSVRISKAGAKQEDPLAKEGIVGAFCRVYSISAVISKYLNDVYEESTVDGRYDYIPADSIAGLVVYDDKFAYSHHASDPASNQLCNAFDLVRIHKFGLDNKSFKKMVDFAMNDDAVKLEVLDEQFNEPSNVSKPSDTVTPLGKNWKLGLTINDYGSIENTSKNLILILENDPDFKNIAYNEFANLVEIIGPVPWDRPLGNKYWRDADENQLKAILDKRYTSFSDRNYTVAFSKVTSDRHFHPIRDYLDSLPKWDGVPRVEELFIKYFNAEDSDYVRAVTRKTFSACVNRIYVPGTKFDSIPVLDGDQGIGKSSIIKNLCGEQYFSDGLALTDMSDKTGSEKLQGFWLIEIGELAGMKKADIEKVKSFISCTDDKYRPSYGRTVESHPRQCVIFATVNGDRGYLRDITGNRRFWIIKLKKESSGWDFPTDKNFKDQFWAEAKEIYLKGEKLYLEGDILEKSKEEQRKAMEQDDRVGVIEEYLNKLLPTNWDNMNLYQRRNFLNGDPLAGTGSVLRTQVSNIEIWAECFNKTPSDMKPQDGYAITALMVQIPGWTRDKKTTRIPQYGVQRVYRKG